MPVSTEKKQGGKFKPGQSGNPKGRPRGARNKATMAAQAILDDQAEKITKKAVNLALKGDSTALKLCLTRLIPPKRDAPIKITLPKIASVEDLPGVITAVTKKLASGQLTPGEAETISKVIEAIRKTYELVEIESRLQALEERLDEK